MNLFKSKKKHEEPAPSPVSPQRASQQQRGSSVNGLNNAQRPAANNGPANPNQGPGSNPNLNNANANPNGANSSTSSLGGMGNAAPGNTPGNAPRSSNNNLDLQQQHLQQQQQQQYYHAQQQQMAQQQQYLQPQQQQHILGDSEPNAVNSAMLSQQQMQQGSYNEALMSQSLHLPYQNDPHSQSGGGSASGQDEGAYDGYRTDDDQGMRNEDGGQDHFYGQIPNASYDSNNSGPLNSGPLHLPNGQPGQPGLDSNGNVLNSNGNNGNGVVNLGNGSGESLPTDVRKLQDEVLSWKKSQEAAQAKLVHLRLTLTQKSQENRELSAGLNQVTKDRLILQEQVNKREKEIDDLRSKYLNDVRQIRATDDDHSTIEQRVRVLQAAILQLTKSSAGDRAVNLKTEAVQQLVKKKYKFGNSQPYILNMFLEKYIMDGLLDEVFHRPFYVGFSLARQYGEIHKWMMDNQFGDQAVRFRQQLCFMSAKAPVAQAHAAEEAQRIAKVFEGMLEPLYNNWNGQQKVLDLVTKAIELSLTMRSQNAEILAKTLASETEFDPEKMVPAHKSKDGGKVKVCVSPCFIDTNGVVVGKAKVFCG